MDRGSMVGAYEVYGAVRELVELGKRGRLGKVELDRAHSLMGLLGDFGFSSGEVSKLVRGRWKPSAVRTYGVSSGVVDLSGRTALLDLVAGFADAGVDLAEVERCRVAKRALGGVGLDFEGAVRLAGDLADRGTAGEVVKLSHEIAETDWTVAEISERLSLETELEAKGFTRGYQLKVLEASKKYGEPEELLEALALYNDLLDLRGRVDDLKREESHLKKDIGELGVRKSRLEDECGARANEILSINIAFMAGFDWVTLRILAVETKDFGGPYKVIDAIKKYKSLGQLETEIGERRKELEKIKREVGDKSMELSAVSNTLGETRRELEASSDVRGVVALLRDPRGLGIDLPSLALLVALVLDSGVENVLKQSKSPLWVPSVNWPIALGHMRTLSLELRGLAGVSGKPAQT